MKRILVLLALSLGAASAASAQAPANAGMATAQATPEQQAQRRTQYLAKELGLSADQQAKLQPILLAQRQEMMAMREKVQTGGRQRGMGQDLKAAQAKYTDQIKAVLTPEQFAKFDQMKDDARDKMRERRASGQGRPAGR
ncbi:hypothetical protein MUN81_13595 [Hymenobacter sp. 5317J-9]|uniref:hypothetical protein n=1 Tax=Hymenobacter sp. 5317J-9 TaxID=2932250 RepID=UPI001FD65ACD|nr:hypothetical protein [Hymenobacter sp. 5317J-9]UOQ96282.1 hypothetical protein MUN81_13595 [Hymenobacter sp. 5317J-9]